MAAPAGPRLNPTSASLLGFLHAGELTGYALVNVADERIGRFWSLTRSQVYRELAGLAVRGLVEAGATGRRAARPYRLTAAGRQAFADWVAQPPGDEQIRYPLLLLVSFGQWLGRDRLLELVTQRRWAHEQRLQDDLDTVAEHGSRMDPYRRATLEFGLRYEQAVLDWMDALPDLLAAQDEHGPA